MCVPVRWVIWKHKTVPLPVPHAQRIFEDFQQRWWFQSIWRGSSSGRCWQMAPLLPPFPKYVLQSEPALAGAGEKSLLVWGKPNSQLLHAQLSLLKLTSCTWSGMAEHIPHSWAPSISCVPTTHRLRLAPVPLRWEVEACIWFRIPPQEANEVEHRKVVLSWVNITRKNCCSVLNQMEQLEKSWDTKKAVFSVAVQSSECSYN